MASASAGESAPSRAARGAMTRSWKIVGLGGALPDRVELLQCEHEGRVGVVAEAALRWPEPGHDRLAGLAVGAAGVAQP